MKRMSRLAASCGMVALFALVLPLGASAHEHRDIAGGQYSVVVGFLNEPAFAGEQNGLSLRVEQHDATATSAAAGGESGTPVVGLTDTLQAEVVFGDQRMPLTLEPAFGQLGAYEAVFFPTTPGDYTFHIFGAIGDTQIDETFTSSPEGFSSVQDPAPLQFPKQAAATDNGVAMAGAVTGSGGESDGFGGAGAASVLGLGLAGAVTWWAIQQVLARRRAVAVSVRG